MKPQIPPPRASLRTLLLCADESNRRLLLGVMKDLEIEAYIAENEQDALRALRTDRLEAVISEYASYPSAGGWHKQAESAHSDRRPIAIAIVPYDFGLKSAFEAGAHFVIYSPLTRERAKASLRAARALMKVERRRRRRIPVSIPVEVSGGEMGGRQSANSLDLSREGMSLQLQSALRPTGQVVVTFTLPGAASPSSFAGEVAWDDGRGKIGVHFFSAEQSVARPLERWIRDQLGPAFSAQSANGVDDDPPLPARLRALSGNSFYLDTPSPFPIGTELTLRLSEGNGSNSDLGATVLASHPETGMEVTLESRREAELSHFMSALAKTAAAGLEILVCPVSLGEAAV